MIVKVDEKLNNCISLRNGTRSLILKFETCFERETWLGLISSKIKEYQHNIKNTYDSFANEKYLCNAKWFVDAEDYFEDLFYKLTDAKESIYIAGWWVSPELYLKRPVYFGSIDTTNLYNQSTKLRDILKKKAEQGVQVHILVYKEVSLALSINSLHTKNSLNKLHPNIKVTRHPKNNLDLLWSHHEKIIIIDQKYGYVGGLDLCWGRYDTIEHKLHEQPNEKEIYFFPGIDYTNARLKDLENVPNYLQETISREDTPRMPWHDVHTLIEGPVVSDLSRHFVERWNYAISRATFIHKKKHTIINCIIFFNF